MSSTTDIYTVYQIKNLINNKVYIGITIRPPEERWKQHQKNHVVQNQILYKSMRKHGIENFQFSIIEQTNNLDYLKELESKYIQEYNSYCFAENSNGYNMTLGGEGTFGLICSKETRKKLSKSGIGRKLSDKAKLHLSEINMGKNNPMYGKKMTDKAKRKISEYRQGRKLSEETKRKISETLKRKTNKN